VTRTNEIDEQASAWIIREGEGLSQAQEAARDAWLETSLANRVAYLRLRSTWQRADRLSILRGTPVIPPTTHAREAHRRLAAGLAVIAITGAVAAGYLYYPRETYETPIGAREMVHLADGSTMELNTDTAVRATVDEKDRRIVLDRGEVFLEVIHDASRPFTVIAGNRRITDLGTKFSVRRDGEKVDVIVSEGRVSIDNLDKTGVAPSVIAQKNTQVLANANNTLVAVKSPEEIHNALGWRQGFLIFNQESLSDAAAEFNRYNQKKLIIDGDIIAKTRIGGSFDASNVDAFARLLREGFGLKVEETDGEVHVSE
jgi:transmembrane sensor